MQLRVKHLFKHLKFRKLSYATFFSAQRKLPSSILAKGMVRSLSTEISAQEIERSPVTFPVLSDALISLQVFCVTFCFPLRSNFREVEKDSDILPLTVWV